MLSSSTTCVFSVIFIFIIKCLLTIVLTTFVSLNLWSRKFQFNVIRFQLIALRNFQEIILRVVDIAIQWMDLKSNFFKINYGELHKNCNVLDNGGQRYYNEGGFYTKRPTDTTCFIAFRTLSLWNSLMTQYFFSLIKIIIRRLNYNEKSSLFHISLVQL